MADMMDRYNQYLGDPGYLPKDIARYQAVTTASVREIGQKEFGQQPARRGLCGAREKRSPTTCRVVPKTRTRT